MSADTTELACMSSIPMASGQLAYWPEAGPVIENQNGSKQRQEKSMSRRYSRESQQAAKSLRWELGHR